MTLGPALSDNLTNVDRSLIPTGDASFDIGSPTMRFRNLYIEGSVIGATFDLANNQWLQSLNAAGSSFLKLLKADASNNTIINALTGKKISFEVNEAEIGKVDANGFTGTAYNLTDGSDKNYNIEAYSAGTAYSLTNTSAALVFGTTSPNITINKAGIYLIKGRVNLKYNGATFAAGRTVTLKLRRTNNTPGDLSNSSTVTVTAIVTTVTATFLVVELPGIIYSTSNLTDIISIFADVSVVPTAGTFDAVEASIVAVRISGT